MTCLPFSGQRMSWPLASSFTAFFTSLIMWQSDSSAIYIHNSLLSVSSWVRPAFDVPQSIKNLLWMSNHITNEQSRTVWLRSTTQWPLKSNCSQTTKIEQCTRQERPKLNSFEELVFYLTEAKKRATASQRSSFKWKTSDLCSGPSRCINDPKLTLQWENTATHLACSINASSIQALLNCRKTLRVRIASNKYTRQTIFFGLVTCKSGTLRVAGPMLCLMNGDEFTFLLCMTGQIPSKRKTLVL